MFVSASVSVERMCFLMGQHVRVGVDSPVNMLDQHLFREISDHLFLNSLTSLYVSAMRDVDEYKGASCLPTFDSMGELSPAIFSYLQDINNVTAREFMTRLRFYFIGRQREYLSQWCCEVICADCGHWNRHLDRYFHASLPAYRVCPDCGHHRMRTKYRIQNNYGSFRYTIESTHHCPKCFHHHFEKKPATYLRTSSAPALLCRVCCGAKLSKTYSLVLGLGLYDQLT